MDVTAVRVEVIEIDCDGLLCDFVRVDSVLVLVTIDRASLGSWDAPTLRL